MIRSVLVLASASAVSAASKFNYTTGHYEMLPDESVGSTFNRKTGGYDLNAKKAVATTGSHFNYRTGAYELSTEHVEPCDDAQTDHWRYIFKTKNNRVSKEDFIDYFKGTTYGHEVRSWTAGHPSHHTVGDYELYVTFLYEENDRTAHPLAPRMP